MFIKPPTKAEAARLSTDELNELKLQLEIKSLIFGTNAEVYLYENDNINAIIRVMENDPSIYWMSWYLPPLSSIPAEVIIDGWIYSKDESIGYAFGFLCDEKYGKSEILIRFRILISTIRFENVEGFSQASWQETVENDVNMLDKKFKIIVNRERLKEQYEEARRIEKEKLPEEAVHFTDPQFKSAIEAELGIKDPRQRDLYDLIYLDASEKQIESIQGIEYAINLKKLILNENQINDISPLSNLDKLEHLSAYDNYIVSIAPLSGLSNLTELNLYDNDIADITPLQQLVSLESLDLNCNKVVDILALASLKELRFLKLELNKIKNISAISELTKLYDLQLGSNNITDISPLAKLNQLDSLRLNDNHISDIEPISHLKNLRRINLRRNPLNRKSHTTYIRRLKSNNSEDSVSYDSSILLNTYHLVAIVICIPVGLYIIYRFRKKLLIVFRLFKYLWKHHQIKTTIGTAVLGFGLMGLYVVFAATDSNIPKYSEILCFIGYILHLVFFVLLFVLLLKNKSLRNYKLIRFMILGALLTYLIPFFAFTVMSFIAIDHITSFSEETAELYFIPSEKMLFIFLWFIPGTVLGAIVSIFAPRKKMNNKKGESKRARAKKVEEWGSALRRLR